MAVFADSICVCDPVLPGERPLESLVVHANRPQHGYRSSFDPHATMPWGSEATASETSDHTGGPQQQQQQPSSSFSGFRPALLPLRRITSQPAGGQGRPPAGFSDSEAAALSLSPSSPPSAAVSAVPIPQLAPPSHPPCSARASLHREAHPRWQQQQQQQQRRQQQRRLHP